MNCDESGTDLTEMSINRPEEIVLEIPITRTIESFGSEFSTTSITSTSTTTRTTTTTTTSTTETANICWGCVIASSSTKFHKYPYKDMSDFSWDDIEDSFWEETDDSDGLDLNWGK